MRRLVPLLAVAALLGCDGPTDRPAAAKEPARIIVAVASSVRVPAEEAAKQFERETGIVVEVTGGATGALAAQARAGAPFDVFLAADGDTPAALAEEGVLDSESVRPYASGRLVLWSREGAVAPDALAGAGWKAKRIAIANPETAPYGRAAMRYLECVGLAEQLRDSLVPASDVRAAYEIAASGNVDAALVAQSVVGDTPFSELACDGEVVAVEHALGVVSTSAHADEAHRFADFLLGESGQRLFAESGLSPVATAVVP